MEKKAFDKFAFNTYTLEDELAKTLPRHNGNYIDAIVDIADSLDLDFEFVAQYLTPALKEAVRKNAIEMNLMKRSTDATMDV